MKKKFTFKKLSKGLSAAKKNISKSVKMQVKKLKNKNELLDSMTNSELEKVYKKYVDTSLMKEVVDSRTDKKSKRKLTRNEIKRTIKFKVSLENIINCIPRLKSKMMKLERELKKIK